MPQARKEKDMLIKKLQHLAKEIIVQAAKDYRDALRILKNDPENCIASADQRISSKLEQIETLRNMASMGSKLMTDMP